MQSRAAAYLNAGAVSLALLVLVLWLAGFGNVDLSAIRPLYLVPTLTAYLLVLVLRGAIFRNLARHAAPKSLGWWVLLAARHQFVFIVSPSGTGDIAFPVLAERMVGLGKGAGTKVIAETRIRDIAVVLGLGCIGLALTGHAPVWVGLGAVLAAAGVIWSDASIQLFGALLSKLRPKRAAFAPRTKVSVPNRLIAALLSLTLWLVATGGIMGGFAAAGAPLSAAEALVMLAGLNVAGAFAMSVAGLGVAEVGAAGVLTFLGVPLSAAAGIALVARPILLGSNAAASGVIEALAWLTRRAS